MKILGILNLTPDSFSDGGEYYANKGEQPSSAMLDRAIARAWEMKEEGASALDVGGESTRPGSHAVSIDEEIGRVRPLLSELQQQQYPLPISLDTRRAKVLEAALPFGVKILNDTAALSDDQDLASLAADAKLKVVLMHRQGTPATMQVKPQYQDIIEEVRNYLSDRVDYAVSEGIETSDIILDPGLGFGKSEEDNYMLMRELSKLDVGGLPWLIGASRKSFLSRYDPSAASKRFIPSLAFVAAAFHSGAEWVRVHDLYETSVFLKTLKDTVKRNAGCSSSELGEFV